MIVVFYVVVFYIVLYVAVKTIKCTHLEYFLALIEVKCRNGPAGRCHRPFRKPPPKRPCFGTQEPSLLGHQQGVDVDWWPIADVAVLALGEKLVQTVASFHKL